MKKTFSGTLAPASFACPILLFSLMFAVFNPSSTRAAIPSRGTSKASSQSRISVEMTKSALGLPMTNRLQTLEMQGPEGYKNLVSIMFNERLSMDARWRAVTAAGRLGGELAKPELTRAMNSQLWYMRNAALVSMSHIDRALAVEWSKKLLSDKSLVVRTAAVSTLSEVGDRSSASLLWEKLYAKENFRGKQSLFIRRHIVDALSKIEAQGTESKFVEILADADETLHPLAIAALERLTQQKLGRDTEPVKFKKAQWQQWWKEKSIRL